MENLLSAWEHVTINQIELVSKHKPLPNGPLLINKCILPSAHYLQDKFQNSKPKIKARI
jgi:hypothetical protein